MSYITIHNIETGEIVEREMTIEEKNKNLEIEAYLVSVRENEAKANNAKAALLEKLGITGEEAKLLLS